ncbi:hypothetical protein GCM10027515_14880 [Schumannella luteola]|uniref:DUF2255 family protein n=1 Tax=Schumannella luteola TaxID=472059 RepID=A0A852Y6K5_9MICO|nr:DUF2255 family protein [Schumannella luteola]NYG97933.1 hypothetical protein [Schumannella luteola]TPX03068.1 DUF2255 family protein [Schumannella luteola]
MTDWTPQQLATLDAEDELEISSHRGDGSLRPFVTIWAVRSGDAIFVRSAYGRDNGWFRRALASGTGQVRFGGVDQQVTFTGIDAADAVNSALDEVYRAKYARYAKNIVDTVVGANAHEVTLRLDPR